MNEKIYYNTREVCQVLGIHINTLYKLRKRGIIPYIKISQKKILYEKCKIDKLEGIKDEPR